MASALGRGPAARATRRSPFKRYSSGRAWWWTSAESGHPSVLVPEVQRAGLVPGLVIGLVLRLVVGLVVVLARGLVVWLGHFRQDIAAKRGAHDDGPLGFASHHHGRASGQVGSSSGIRIARASCELSQARPPWLGAVAGLSGCGPLITGAAFR